MTRLRPVLAAVALACALSSTAWSADLKTAKTLYVEASYEEALAALAALDGSEAFEDVSQIRALCLLALGRTPAAELAVQELVLRSPGFKVEAREVSPKFVELFNDVRRRTLPAAVRVVYGRAKSHYDAKRWPDAAREFSGLVAVLAEPDVVAQQPALADLRELSEGFLRLSEAEVAALEARRRAEAPPAPVAPPAAEARPTVALAEPQERLIYAAGDAGVTPALELPRSMPRWAPTTPAMKLFAATGVLEIVIDETGAVERATMLKRTAPAYDEALLRAARTWKYVPARKGTKPVRYRHLFEVSLRPPQ